MPKKGSKKAGPKDWGKVQRENWVNVEVRNSKWASMRFTSLMRTTETLETVRRLIIDQHQVSIDEGLRMYLGTECVPECEFQSSDFRLRLQELGMIGGSKNDKVVNVITYQYAPFESALRLPPLAIPTSVATLAKGMSTNIPRGVATAAMFVNGVDGDGLGDGDDEYPGDGEGGDDDDT